MFSQKLQKRFRLFGNIWYLIRGKKVYINFWGKMPSFPKKWSNVPPKQFFSFLKKYFFFFFFFFNNRVE